MIALADPSLCNGCQACAGVCPRQAISLAENGEGFLEPRVDSSRCARCRLCEKACPVLNPVAARSPLAVFAVRARDLPLRLRSSSGGVFSLLARDEIARGGVVFGAAWDCEALGAKFAAAESEEGLDALRGSKYVQADVGSAYRQAGDALASGRRVLFSGTPCQVAALRRVLGADAPNLLCVDVVCHAAPSPLAFRAYAAQRQRVARAKVARIFSRSKAVSWERFAQFVEFHSGAPAYLETADRDPFLRGFRAELYSRPSCHRCAVRELRSGSDLTLGDYWGVRRRFPELDDARGTSAVLVHTAKGRAALDAVLPRCDAAESDYADFLRGNPAVRWSFPPNRRRARFFARLRGTEDFDRLVWELLRPSPARRLRAFAGRALRGLGLRK